MMTAQPTTTAPHRVQRRRTAGQPGMPPGATYVGRGSKWGNPARIGVARDRDTGRRRGWSVWDLFQHRYGRTHQIQADARAEAAWQFEKWLRERRPDLADATRRELAGKDLACWCPLPQPGEPDHCHGAVLLNVAAEKNPLAGLWPAPAVSGSGAGRAQDGGRS